MKRRMTPSKLDAVLLSAITAPAPITSNPAAAAPPLAEFVHEVLDGLNMMADIMSFLSGPMDPRFTATPCRAPEVE